MIGKQSLDNTKRSTQDSNLKNYSGIIKAHEEDVDFFPDGKRKTNFTVMENIDFFN